MEMKSYKELYDYFFQCKESNRIVSFDIFDTLLKRIIPPEIVKLLTSEYFSSILVKNNIFIPQFDLYQYRKKIEIALENQNESKGLDRDYKYDNCITEWVTYYLEDNLDVVRDIKEYELNLEANCLIVIPEMVKILELLNKSNVKTIYISDMYLGRINIERILKEKGLWQYFSCGYVSSDYDKRKDTGKLYQYVLENENITPSEILHVGDNRHSDYQVPRMLNIQSINMTIESEKKRYGTLTHELAELYSGKMFSIKNYDSIIRTNLKYESFVGISDDQIDIALGIAYPFIDFIYSVIDYCKSNDIDRVYFLSREGYLLKNIFDVIDVHGIKGYYLHASRASTYLLNMKNIDLYRIIDDFKNHAIFTISLKNVLKLIGLSFENYTGLFKMYEIDPDKVVSINCNEEVNKINNFLMDYVIQNDYRKNREEYVQKFIKYLSQLDFFAGNRILIVDIGWKGSMQYYISNVLDEMDKKVEIHGYYFGYDEFSDNNKNIQKSGYFTIKSGEEFSNRRIIHNFLFELIPTANHSSVEGYYYENGIIKPRFFNNKEEVKQYFDKIKGIQDIIVEYARKFVQYRMIFSFNFSTEKKYSYSYDVCTEFVTRPAYRVAKYISTFVFHDNFFGHYRRMRFDNPFIWWPEGYDAIDNIFKKIRRRLIHYKNIINIKLTRIMNIIIILGFKEIVQRINGRIRKRIFGNNYQNTNWTDRINSQYRYKHYCEGKIIEETSLDLIFAFIIVIKNDDYLDVHYWAELRKTGCIGNNNFIYERKWNIWKQIDTRNDDIVSAIRETDVAQVEKMLICSKYVFFVEGKVIFEPAFIEKISVNMYSGNADLIYSNNDEIGNDGVYCNPKFKPGLSREYLLEYDYIGSCYAISINCIIYSMGNIIKLLMEKGIYYILINILLKIKKYELVENVLYHSDQSTRYEVKTEEVLVYYMKINNFKAGLKKISSNRYVIQYLQNHDSKVSIIIPFKDKVDLLKTCVKSIIEKTTYRNYELILIDNKSEMEDTHKYLDAISKCANVQVLNYDHEFNYAAINNYAVSQSNGKYVLFLNNDTEVKTVDWIERMMNHALCDGIGCVGAKLLYTDMTVQHAGVVFDFNDNYPAAHVFHRDRSNSKGYMNRLITTQNYSAVTAACLLMSRDVFVKTGMFDETFRVAYNDLDLCCRIRESGYNIIWTPDAVLFHHENASRGLPGISDLDRVEKNRFKEKWKNYFKNGDPFYSTMFDLSGNIK